MERRGRRVPRCRWWEQDGGELLPGGGKYRGDNPVSRESHAWSYLSHGRASTVLGRMRGLRTASPGRSQHLSLGRKAPSCPRGGRGVTAWSRARPEAGPPPGPAGTGRTPLSRGHCCDPGVTLLQGIRVRVSPASPAHHIVTPLWGGGGPPVLHAPSSQLSLSYIGRGHEFDTEHR